jgi:hypothetical protein
MNTSINQLELRNDVRQFVEPHLAGLDAKAIDEQDCWQRYRGFRTALHSVTGCGAPPEMNDHSQFLRGIQEFCRRIRI